MKESTLKEVREEYNQIKKEVETLISYRDELIELTKDEKVKRFLELSKLVDKDYTGPSEETIVMRAYQGVPEAFGEHAINSNHIMVFMGSFIIKSSKDKNDDYMTYERDPDTTYRAYRDLETTKWHYIGKDKCLEFETEYTTLYLPVSEYTEKEYSKKYIELHKWFKTQLIHRSQFDVIKELQEKYEREYKIYPFFHKIDTIKGLPIEKYIESYAADGFVEKYALTNEERMRVKLYRKQLNDNL